MRVARPNETVALTAPPTWQLGPPRGRQVHWWLARGPEHIGAGCHILPRSPSQGPEPFASNGQMPLPSEAALRSGACEERWCRGASGQQAFTGGRGGTAERGVPQTG